MEQPESQFRLRIPADLKAKVEAAARAAGRSINAQVLISLQASFDQEDELAEMRAEHDAMDKRIDKLEYQVSELMGHIGLSEV